jgi:hypothetical protein
VTKDRQGKGNATEEGQGKGKRNVKRNIKNLLIKPQGKIACRTVERVTGSRAMGYRSQTGAGIISAGGITLRSKFLR